jgi:hypothetical protein
MSRTYSHKNYVGRFLSEKNPREVHDHRHGDCDLPPREEWERMLKEARHPYYLFNAYRCAWDFPIDYYITNKMCGCAMCTGYYDRKEERKQERRVGKRISQNYDTLLDDDDF